MKREIPRRFAPRNDKSLYGFASARRELSWNEDWNFSRSG
jgi:hypothetical protein